MSKPFLKSREEFFCAAVRVSQLSLAGFSFKGLEGLVISDKTLFLNSFPLGQKDNFCQPVHLK